MHPLAPLTVIKILTSICAYLIAVRMFWCKMSPGVCGSCGLGRPCRNDSECVGFLPLIPGRIQPFSKCKVTDNDDDDNGEEESIIEEWSQWVESLPCGEQQRDETSALALYLRDKKRT